MTLAIFCSPFNFLSFERTRDKWVPDLLEVLELPPDTIVDLINDKEAPDNFLITFLDGKALGKILVEDDDAPKPGEKVNLQ